MFGKKFTPNFLDVLAAICGRGIKHYAVQFKTPRDWIEWRVGGRCVRPAPRQPVGGHRYDELQRHRKLARRAARPINYDKQFNRAHGYISQQRAAARVPA